MRQRRKALSKLEGLLEIVTESWDDDEKCQGQLVHIWIAGGRGFLIFGAATLKLRAPNKVRTNGTESTDWYLTTWKNEWDDEHARLNIQADGQAERNGEYGKCGETRGRMMVISISLSACLTTRYVCNQLPNHSQLGNSIFGLQERLLI